ncbi:MAG TPA: hypothetical protein VGP77_10045 [Vicinamibacterales bacterium]|jgi:hypothetical protein|nr:hypothetical protein [Vicinamibacterales bacterium]
MKTLLPAVATIAASLLVPAAALAQPRPSGKTYTRQILVNVTDKEGAPITGLAAADFRVSEGVAEDLSQSSGGDYDVMNTTAALADETTALAQTLARAHRNMNGWYAVDFQRAAAEAHAVGVTVGRDDVLLRVSDRPRGQ